MKTSQADLTEQQRLATLRRYGVLNTPPIRALDDLTELTAAICEVPIAVITLVDEKNVRFKAKFGVDVSGIPRGGTFCDYALQAKDVLVVPDAAKDERFAKIPLVQTESGIRFYAGSPLVTPEGYALGTLCVLDRVPRTLTPSQLDKLRVLSRQVMAHMELHRQACELQEKERVHTTLIGNLPGMAFRGIKNRERTLTFVSEGCKTITGYEARELEGNRFVSYGSLIHPDDRGWTWDRCKADLDGGRPSTAEYRIIDRAGKTRWVSERVTGFYDKDGKLLSIEGFIQEITERKLAEQERSLSLSLMTATLESTADGILVVSPEGKIVTFNQIFVRMWRMKEELIASRDDQLCLQYALSQLSEPEQFIDKVNYLYQHPLEESFDTLPFKDGRIFERYSRPQIISGEVVGRVWSFRDVTEKKKVETAQHESEERFRLLFEGAKDAIFGADAETGIITECNRAAETLMGWTRDELIGKHHSFVHPPEEVERYREIFQEHARSESSGPIEVEILRKDGLRVPVSISPAVVTIRGRQIVQGIFRDITERKRMERLLAWEKEALELIATTVSLDEILTKLMLGLEAHAPGALGSVLLLDDDEIHLRHGAGPSLPAAYNQAIDGVAIGPQVGSCGTAAFTKRQMIVADIANDPLWKDYRDLALGHGLAACWSTPIHGSTGKLLGTFAIYFREPREPTPAEQEMISQVQYLVGLAIERKELERQFLRAQRMESIGTLAGGIAHDLNNALAPILMSLGVLKERFPDKESSHLIDVLCGSVQRGADMVRQVLSFARGVQGRRMEVNIRHIVQEIENTVRNTFLKSVAMQTVIPNEPWTIMGDPTQIHQVLLNLCVNARDAMPEGGGLTISAENLHLDVHHASLNHEAKPGPYVLIHIEDTGRGIPPGILDKIFDPFFTTKEVGKGTGLGLSTSLAIVKSHGGFMRVYSEVGKGTRFHIYLPARTVTPEDAAKEPAAKLPRGNGELILVVDDEAAVRLITQRTLEAFGYRVLLAAEGAEAVALYAKQRDEIDLVLTDMTMPVMDGLAAIQLLQKLDPEVRIIAASGLTANNQLTGLGVRHFLPKPYTTETLLNTVNEILSPI